MLLEISRCNGNDTGLFEDFAKYKTLDNYLTAIVECGPENCDDVGFYPVQCAIADTKTGELRWIVRDGEITPDAEQLIKRIKHLRKDMRYFMSDAMIVNADMFERDIYISWMFE